MMKLSVLVVPIPVDEAITSRSSVVTTSTKYIEILVLDLVQHKCYLKLK